jgi:hypothetical protein
MCERSSSHPLPHTCTPAQSGSYFYNEPPFILEYGYPINVNGTFTGFYRQYPGILADEIAKVNATGIFFGTWRTRTDMMTAANQLFVTRAYS